MEETHALCGQHVKIHKMVWAKMCKTHVLFEPKPPLTGPICIPDGSIPSPHYNPIILYMDQHNYVRGIKKSTPALFIPTTLIFTCHIFNLPPTPPIHITHTPCTFHHHSVPTFQPPLLSLTLFIPSTGHPF